MGNMTCQGCQLRHLPPTDLIRVWIVRWFLTKVMWLPILVLNLATTSLSRTPPYGSPRMSSTCKKMELWSPMAKTTAILWRIRPHRYIWICTTPDHKMKLKGRAKLKIWLPSQIQDLIVMVTQMTSALKRWPWSWLIDYNTRPRISCFLQTLTWRASRVSKYSTLKMLRIHPKFKLTREEIVSRPRRPSCDLSSLKICISMKTLTTWIIRVAISLTTAIWRELWISISTRKPPPKDPTKSAMLSCAS